MGRTTKEITGCTILNPLTPTGTMRAIKMLTELSLKNAGLQADLTPRLRKTGETGIAVRVVKTKEEVG